MSNRPNHQTAQLAFAILLVLGVFAGGVAIAVAADDDVPDVTTATEPEVSETPASTSTDPAIPSSTVPAKAEPAKLIDDSEPADDSIVADTCSYEPTPEVLADIVTESDELAAILDRFEIEYERVSEEGGFVYLEYDWNNPIIESVVSSFYEDRYAPDAAELGLMKAVNAELIAAFDAAGVEYTTESEFDFDWIDWDYDNDEANAVADPIIEAAFGSFGEEDGCLDDYELSDEELADMAEVNAALIAAFEAANISYELVEDGPFTHVEFDYADSLANDIAEGVYEEQYGPFEADEFVDGDFPSIDNEARSAVLRGFATELTAAGVDVSVHDGGEDEFGEWMRVTFDLTNPAADAVVVLAASEPTA